ncbi:MAG: S9 family peptidase [Ktedonobacterales bacterium]
MGESSALPGLVPEDFWNLRFVTEVQPAPDGQSVAYTIEWNDQETNEKRSSIWLYELASARSRQLTSGQKCDSSPRWSPDGSQLAFVSSREGSETQIYVLPLAGGEPRRLTRMRRGAGEPFWSADGRWLGFETEVRPGDTPTNPDLRDAATREREEKEEVERPHIYTRQQYRWDGKGYLEGRTHLFRVWLESAEVKALTEGDYDNTNGACSPDGRWLAFTSDRGPDRDANMATDIYLLDLQDNRLRCLTGGKYEVGRLTWSRDSKHIAAIGCPIVAEHAAYNEALLVVPAQAGEALNLLEGQDISAASGLYGDVPGPDSGRPVWSSDGQEIYFVTDKRGGTAIFCAPLAGGPPRQIVSEPLKHIGQLALLLPSTGNHRLVALSADATDLWNIWLYAWSDDQGRVESQRLTNTNADFLAARRLVTPQRFRCLSFDGTEIDGWLYRPSGSPVAIATPLILIIHGGPHAAYGESFMLRAQILAGKGYAVLYANPRGSTGYGEAFVQACDLDWGGGDFRDLMVVLDSALALGGLDPLRLGITGASYGGYMTNWIIGQNNRFQAAVTVHSVTNLYSCFGTGDIDSFSAEGDYGWPWEQESFYHERSPITYAERVRTPVRIIAAENDFRCPISQSEEFYTWLKKRAGVPVELVRLPGASHQSYASPRQRIGYLNLVFEWFERWIPISLSGVRPA